MFIFVALAYGFSFSFSLCFCLIRKYFAYAAWENAKEFLFILLYTYNLLDDIVIIFDCIIAILHGPWSFPDSAQA